MRCVGRSGSEAFREQNGPGKGADKKNIHIHEDKSIPGGGNGQALKFIIHSGEQLMFQFGPSGALFQGNRVTRLPGMNLDTGLSGQVLQAGFGFADAHQVEGVSRRLLSGFQPGGDLKQGSPEKQEALGTPEIGHTDKIKSHAMFGLREGRGVHPLFSTDSCHSTISALPGNPWKGSRLQIWMAFGKRSCLGCEGKAGSKNRLRFPDILLS